MRKGNTTVWRVNVLAIILGGYVVAALLFLAAIIMTLMNEHAVAEAVFETAENITLVLFGGSIGVAKDMGQQDVDEAIAIGRNGNGNGNGNGNNVTTTTTS